MAIISFAARHCKAMVVGPQVRAVRIVSSGPILSQGQRHAAPDLCRPPGAVFAAVSAAALALLLASAAPLRAQDKDPVVAKVNGAEIHQSDLAVAEEEAGQLPPMSPDQKQDYLIQFTADMMLLAKAAEDKKLGDAPDFKRKLDFARNKLLMETLLQSVGKAGADR